MLVFVYWPKMHIYFRFVLFLAEMKIYATV